MTPLLDMVPSRCEVDAAPVGTLSAFNTSASVLCIWSADGGWYRRSARRVVNDHLDHVLIIVPLRGGIRTAADGAAVRLRTWDVGILDLVSPITARIDSGELIILFVPRMLLPAEAAVGLSGGRVFCREEAIGELLGRTLSVMANLAPRLTAEQGALLTRHVVELLAQTLMTAGRPRRLKRGMAGNLDTARSTRSVEPVLLGKIRQYIEQNLTMPGLGPGHLAMEFGLSRSQLYRLFEPMDGVLNYIRDTRLRKAFVLLQDSDRAHERIGDIAFDLGFTDLAHFSRLFRKAFGLSPRAVRKTALVEPHPRAPLGCAPPIGQAETLEANDPRQMFVQWLREIRER